MFFCLNCLGGIAIKKITEYKLLSHRVYEEIKNAINSGELNSKEKITETSLAKALGVSRTPIREALKILQTEGYLCLIPNSGVVINSFDEKKAVEIFQIRGALEGLAAKILAETLDENKIFILNNYKNKIRKREFDLSKFDEAYQFYYEDIDFHDMIFELTGNELLISISESLKDQMIRFRIAISKTENAVKISEEHHFSILNAILNKNSSLAQKFSQNHIDYVQKEILPLISRDLEK